MWILNRWPQWCLACAAMVFLAGAAGAQTLKLPDLVNEALSKNPEILAFRARADAARLRVSQAKSLPDPMVMVGYQNEGLSRYTYGEESGAQWMFSASQQYPFPGKRALKGDMAVRDAESLEAMYEQTKLKTILRVRELYLDLFLAYKNIDLLRERRTLFDRIEALALARYAAGKAMQPEVLMAQTEKYMLMEKEAMLRQKIESLDAMLRAAVGRDGGESLGRPADPQHEVFSRPANAMIESALHHSPEIKARNKMIEAAEARVQMARKEFYPDIGVSAGYYSRRGDFKDMWSLTSQINIPLYFKTKQEPALLEARAGLNQARAELTAVKLMIVASVKDNLSMIRAADTLMDLYLNGLMIKNRQDVESALSGYTTGNTDAVVVLSRLKALLDYEVQYWTQFTERAKAIARIRSIFEEPETQTGGEKK